MSNNRKDASDQVLQSLLGLPLSDMWRAGVQIFEFGEQKPALNRKGEAVTRADYALHVDCPWRIVRAERIIIASWDYLGGDEKPNDQYSEAFFNAKEVGQLIVENANTTSLGDINVCISDGYSLQVFAMSSLNGDEYWRLLTTFADGTNQHFVATQSGMYVTSRSDR